MNVIVENKSGYRFHGWIPYGTIAAPTPEQVAIGHGTFGDTGWPFELGESLGVLGHELRLAVELAPGQVVERELTWASSSGNRPSESSSISEITESRGVPSVAGEALDYVGMEGVWDHWSGRIGFFVYDLWMEIREEQPFAAFELLVTASDPSVPDLFAYTDPFLHLSFGTGVVTFLDGSYGEILPAGETFADGQSRAKLGVITWPNLFRVGHPDADSARALATGMVNVIDSAWIKHAGPMSGVAEAVGYDGSHEAVVQFHAGKFAINSWAPSGRGIAAKATQTGPQADQGYGGKGTALAHNGGALTGKALLLTGLDAAKRPCHHREWDGSLLGLDSHPDLTMWMSRPHYNLSESRDQLGKFREVNGTFWPLQDSETPLGWWGDDREHWFHNTLFAGYQMTGSPMAQCLIETRARNFLFQETVDPRKVTSSADAARSWGWASLMVNWLWLTLKDQALMRRVVDRFWGRIAIYRQASAHGRLWDQRMLDYVNDELVGVSKEVWSGPLPCPFTAFVLGYQAGFAAGMLVQFGQAFSSEEVVAWAFQQAKLVMDSSYKQLPDGSWQFWESLACRADGSTIPPEEFIEGVGAHRSGQDFESTWMAPAIRAVLMTEPQNAKAQSIMERIKSKLVAGAQPLEWLAPMEWA